MNILVLLRHGQSAWNLENRFTGWTDVPLSPKGEEEALAAGAALQKAGLCPQIAFVSVLQRAEETLALALKSCGLNVPIVKSWRLNERHYGALQGLNKAETAAKYGTEQVRRWRRSYDEQPPHVEKNDPRFPGNDPKYAAISAALLPCGESLRDTELRAMPFWESDIAPALLSGKTVLVTAHGNSIRAIVKHLENIPSAEIPGLEIPTGAPLVYELDGLMPVKKYYLSGETLP